MSTHLSYNRNYGRFSLECWGNGFAYALTENATQLQCYVQGEDATQFESDMLGLEITFPDMLFDDVMAYLWDHYDYSVGAIQK